MGVDALFDERLTTYGRFVEAQRRLALVFDETFEEHGLTASWFEAMLRISRSEGQQLRMCQIADQMSITKGGATRLVEVLMREGLVEKRDDPDDRRAQLVSLSPEGRRRLECAAAAHLVDIDEQLLQRLDGKDVGELNRLLDRLRFAPDQP